MAKLPTYVGMDLSTVSNSEDKVVVDKKLLEIFFKNYSPASFEDYKASLIGIIESSGTMEELRTNVEENMYTASIATEYIRRIENPPLSTTEYNEKLRRMPVGG